MRRLSLVIIAASLLWGCDSVDADRFEPEFVVESYQLVGSPLAQVRLTRTAPVGGTFSADEQAVRGARVEVRLLDAGGAVEAVFPYEERAGAPGVYEAMEPPVVLPDRAYALEAVTPEGDRIEARTRTPGRLSIVEANADTVYYQTRRQLTVTLRREDYAGRQNVYLFTTEALDARPEMLVPLYRTLYDQGEFEIEDVRVSGSPLLNEGNYEIPAENTIQITLPWLAVAFFGPNQISLSAVDENLYDFIRSQQAQSGGSTLAPGEIPNVLERVEGGTGVFGSYSRVSYVVVVAPAPAE